MVNQYTRQSSRKSTPEEVILQAVNRVIDENKTVRGTAKDFGIPHVSLKMYVDKRRKFYQEKSSSSNAAPPLSGYGKPRMIFPEDQESVLAIFSDARIYTSD
jgi:transposase-like protein